MNGVAVRIEQANSRFQRQGRALAWANGPGKVIFLTKSAEGATSKKG